MLCCHKSCRLGCKYSRAGVVVAADRLISSCATTIGRSGLVVTGLSGLAVRSPICGQCCSYGPMDIEGSVEQAMPDGGLVSWSVGQSVGREERGWAEKNERTLGVVSGVI